MRSREELKKSENFAANTTGYSNSSASTEAVPQEQSFKAINPVTDLQTNKGFPSFYSSFGS